MTRQPRPKQPKQQASPKRVVSRKRAKKQQPKKAESRFPDISHVKKRAFLAAFSECGVISFAARAAGITRRTHNNWTNQSGKAGDDYRKAFADAKEQACDSLEQEAIRRATHGVRRLKFNKGEPLIDPETGGPYIEYEYSDTLLIFLMKGFMPDKYRERADIRQTTESIIKVEAQTVDDWYGNAVRVRTASNGTPGNHTPIADTP